MVYKSILGTVCACLTLMSFSTSAALIGRLAATPGGTDYQAYYDDVADLTWLADATANGQMNWQAANDWAAQLTVGGVSGWRLPDTIDVGNDGATYTNFYQGVDYGYNITTPSELSNMFYNVLGNIALYDTNGNIQSGGGLQNTGLFTNLFNERYWSSTYYNSALYTGSAWVFNMKGFQGNATDTFGFYAWAVQSGDVSAVPVPAAVWLFGSGLLGFIGVARRKKL